MKQLILAIILLLIFSCTNSSILSKKVKNLDESNFFTALALGYNQLSLSEITESDWKDADEFAAKGLAALNKQYVALGSPFERNINNNLTLEELNIARAKLLEILDDRTKLDFPFKSARLYILYDYWLEQAEEDWQTQDIKRYRIEFWQTYEALKKAKYLASLKLNKKLSKNNYYSIYFDHDKDNLDQIAQGSINRLIYYLNGLADYKIIMEGHTDLSGDKQVNYALAKSRLSNIKQALIKVGINKQAFIREEIYGKAQPKIPLTSGGYIDRLNRRVEIYVIPINK
jgi:outer membrane protein OmpA-like peptidoglycan-associated protein